MEQTDLRLITEYQQTVIIAAAMVSNSQQNNDDVVIDRPLLLPASQPQGRRRDASKLLQQ